jgi:hypothetical protein
MGSDDKKMSADDIIQEKLRAKAQEAEEEARSGGGRSGGINIGGNVGHVGGNIVGGDLIGDANVTTTRTSGVTADEFAKAFGAIYDKINQKPPEVRADVKEAVDTLKQAAEQEVAAGQPPDEKQVTTAAKALAVDAPDLLQDVADVALATLTNPAQGVLTIVRKVLERIKAQRAGGAA